MAKKRTSTKEPSWQQLSLQIARILQKRQAERDIAEIERRHRLYAAIFGGKPIKFSFDGSFNWPVQAKVSDHPRRSKDRVTPKPSGRKAHS